jgi:hypothetical protein
MKKFLFLLIVIGLIISACAPVGVDAIEQSQQKAGNMAIVQNQPIPDLGGYSFERDILIQTYIARNNTISTYAYMFTIQLVIQFHIPLN